MRRSFYIASALENAAQVVAVKSALEVFGWMHTYDWTVHGSVQTCGVERIAEVAKAEARGVDDADVVIVLLPGGRGTHTELGIALGRMLTDDKRICIYSPTPEQDFGTSGKTCAFYHHPLVERFDDLEAMIDALLTGTP